DSILAAEFTVDVALRHLGARGDLARLRRAVTVRAQHVEGGVQDARSCAARRVGSTVGIRTSAFHAKRSCMVPEGTVYRDRLVPDGTTSQPRRLTHAELLARRTFTGRGSRPGTRRPLRPRDQDL